MPYSRSVLEFVHKLIRQQQKRSDYDELYFGVQDLEFMLEREAFRGSRRPAGASKSVRRVAGGVAFKKKRKLSAWNKYVKANSKKPRFR